MGRTQRQLEKIRKATFIEMGMAILGFVWLGLLIVEFIYGTTPTLALFLNIIWVVFIIEFLAGLISSTSRRRYLRKNWLVALSLMIPAIRVFRIFRVIRILRMTSVLRGIRLARLFTSFRRSLKALGATMQRRGFGYAAALTTTVILAGAAGMYAFERNAEAQPGFTSYPESLYWTAMLVTTMGSQVWPVTTEGKILCLMLSVYSVSVLGYIAATLASYFIDRDASLTVRPKDIRNLREAVERLNEEIKNCTGPLEQMEQQHKDKKQDV